MPPKLRGGRGGASGVDPLSQQRATVSTRGSAHLPNIKQKPQPTDSKQTVPVLQKKIEMMHKKIENKRKAVREVQDDIREMKFDSEQKQEMRNMQENMIDMYEVHLDEHIRAKEDFLKEYGDNLERTKEKIQWKRNVIEERERYNVEMDSIPKNVKAIQTEVAAVEQRIKSVEKENEETNRLKDEAKNLAQWVDEHVLDETNSSVDTEDTFISTVSAIAFFYGRNLAMLVFSRLMFLYVFGCDSLVFTSNKWSSIDKSMFASSFKVHGIGPAKIARRLRKHTNLEKNDMFVFHFGRKLRLDRDALRKHECDHGALPEDACESEIFTRAIIRSNCEKCECNGIFLQDTLRALQFPQSNRMKDYKVGSSFIQEISKTHISLSNYTKHILYINSGTKGLELQDGMGNRSNIRLDARKRLHLSYQLGDGIGLAKLSFTSTPCSKKELKIIQAKTDSIEEKENEYEKEEEEETEKEENGIIDLTEMFASVHTRDL